MKCLIVEDSKVMAQVLTGLVHSVTQKEDGTFDDVVHVDNMLLAFNVLAKDIFDYIFLDLNLRDDLDSSDRRDGLRILEYVRTLKKNIPVFIVTGDSNIETVKEVLKYKPTDYLVKPVTKDKISRCMEKVKNSTPA